MNKTGSSTVRIDLLSDIDNTRVKKILATDLLRRKTDSIAAPNATSVPTALKMNGDVLFQALYDAVLITSQDGLILAANERASALFNSSTEQLTGSHFVEWFYGADYSLLNTIQTHLEHRRFILLKAYGERTDSLFFPAEIAVSSLIVNQASCLLLSVRDITVREQAIQARQRMEFMVNQVDAISFILSRENNDVSFISDGIRLLGYEPQDFISGRTHMDELIHPDEYPSMKAWRKQFVQSGHDQLTCTCHVRDRRDVYHPMELKLWLFQNYGEQHDNVLGMLFDCSEKTETTEENTPMPANDQRCTHSAERVVLDRINRALTEAAKSLEALAEVQAIVNQAQSDSASLLNAGSAWQNKAEIRPGSIEETTSDN
ncbi:MAG: PAS domain S-box protein [Spartobacteria bacterium]|nr:PAS domain S-box protein [Spartobacteria bacterium]